MVGVVWRSPTASVGAFQPLAKMSLSPHGSDRGSLVSGRNFLSETGDSCLFYRDTYQTTLFCIEVDNPH